MWKIVRQIARTGIRTEAAPFAWSSYSLERRGERAARQDAHQVIAKFDRAAMIVDGARGAGCGLMAA